MLLGPEPAALPASLAPAPKAVPATAPPVAAAVVLLLESVGSLPLPLLMLWLLSCPPMRPL